MIMDLTIMIFMKDMRLMLYNIKPTYEAKWYCIRVSLYLTLFFNNKHNFEKSC